MANWCFTDYTVTGDKSELKELYQAMVRLQDADKPLVKNCFGTTWLGNLVFYFGGNTDCVYCRGEWIGVDLTEESLIFSTETAWAPMFEVIDFLKTKFPTLTFYFQAEEPGCEYYVTNDKDGKFYPEKYCLKNEIDNYYYTKDELNSLLLNVEELVGKKVNTFHEVEAAIEEYAKANPDTYCAVWEYKLVGELT